MTTFKRISSATSTVKKLSPISAGKKEGKATVLALKEPGLAANLSCREDWSTGRQFLMACCHEKSATGSHLLCSSQTARKGRKEESGRGRRGEMLSIPTPASSLLLTILVKVSWFFSFGWNMSSLQSYYPSSKVTVVWRLTLSFYLNPFFPHFEKGLSTFIILYSFPLFVNQYSLDQGTSITALHQQGASSLNKIQVWKILKDERDAMAPSGVIFLSQTFSQLNICASAVGLRRHGALPSWERVLKLGFINCDLIHYNLLWR